MDMTTPPIAGEAVWLDPLLRRVLAPNPSPMTYWGTNSYLLGSDAGLCVIDPGPDEPAHLAALLAAIGPAPVSHIVVTHSHKDHSPLARPLAAATGAPVVAFGDATAGRSAIMAKLVEGGLTGGGEGIDYAFAPDIVVADADRITGADWQLDVIHTPGHLGNHICLRWEDQMFTGDHVMGWASSLVSPPDGDLTQFMASCARLQKEKVRIYHPGHGEPVEDPAGRLDWLINHRIGREDQILDVLGSAPGALTVSDLTKAIYHDAPPGLQQAAARNVLAHLIDLIGRNRIKADLPLSATSRFSPVENSVQ